MNDTKPPTDLFQRFLPMLGVFAVSFASVGFLVGIREPAKTERLSRPEAESLLNTPPAVAYAQLSEAKLKPNAAWHQTLSQLQYDKPGVFDPVVRTEAMKLTSLADRAQNRAYDGAPPTIPHPVTTSSALGCLACHGEGLKVGERLASKMSHAFMSNCTQCHVEQATLAVDNDFVGLSQSGPGERAHPAAPPTIPHHTWLRENCTSCHGLVTRPGLRTTHPWLTNCTQCHAPSAILDQRDYSGEAR